MRTSMSVLLVGLVVGLSPAWGQTGACCRFDGTCQVTTEVGCLHSGSG